MGKNRLALAGLWLGLLLVSLASRPLMPIDELRYVSVAWEMWLGGDWLVPHLNGLPYSDKPPLLFWLIGLGWRLFGVNEWWPRVAPSIIGLAGIYLTQWLAIRLWPEDRDAAALAPWMLLGTILWPVCGTLTMFDSLVAVATLLALGGIVLARSGRALGWPLYGLALGAGILAKGPVILGHTLPAALLAPWWGAEPEHGRRAGWYPALAAATLGGVAVGLLWAVPAAAAGGADYRGDLLWGQTAHRVVASFAHARPWWWYVPALGPVLFPWVGWPALWRALGRGLRRPLDSGTRFCVAWLLPSFVLLSLVSGKQPQYLLPLLPGFVLLAARALTLRPAAPGRSGRLLPAVAMLLIGAASLAAKQARLPGLPAWTGEIAPWSGPALMIGAALLLAPPPTSSRREVGLLAVGTWVVLVVLHLGVLRPAGPAYDVRGLAERLRAAQEAGRAVAHVGNYEGQYQFVGRLREPLEEIEPSAVGDWARRHADGVLVTYSRKWNPPAAAAREFVQPYRGQSAMICSAEAIRVLEPAPADAPQR